MKQIVLSLFALVIGAFANAQNIELHYNGAPITTNYYEVDSTLDDAYAQKYFYMVNVSGTDQIVSWSRNRLAHDSSINLDQVCDDVLCFDCDDANFFSRPLSQSVELNIAAGDSSILWPKVYHGNQAACAIYTYRVTTGIGTLEDSIQVKWKFGGADCFLRAEEQDLYFQYKAFPNPVSDVFSIDLKTNANNISVNIFNVLGELVESSGLSEGLNQIAIDKLNNGVYFYSIIRNGELVETKKFLKR